MEPSVGSQPLLQAPVSVRPWRVTGLEALTPPISILAILLVLSVSIPIVSEVFLYRGFLHQSLFALPNLAGPATESLLKGQGLLFHIDDLGMPGNTVFFHAGRMPIVSLVIALGIRLFGNSFPAVAVFKTLLLLLPLQLSIFLVWKRMPASPVLRACMALLLFAPFAVRAFIAVAVSLQVEEGYSYSILALGVTLVLFGPYTRRPKRAIAPDLSPTSSSPSMSYVVCMALVADALYLSKSSMAPAFLVLAVAFFLQLRTPASRLLLVALVAAAPLGWAIHQHHASGRSSLGTSLDGFNFHKGNEPFFLDIYPSDRVALDEYDATLSQGHRFRDEWEFDDYHRLAAVKFILAHPGQTIVADWRKLSIVFFSLQKYATPPALGFQHKVEIAGILLFRLILWASVGCALFGVLTRTGTRLRMAAAAYLFILAAYALPYVAGFAYTRHAIILAYPASLMCCRFLCDRASAR